MLLCRLFGNQQNKEQIDRATIGRIERHRRDQTHECADCLFQPLDAAMRNRHTLAQAGRAQFFTSEQAIKDYRAGEAEVILEKHAGLFENPLFTTGVEIEQNLLGRKKIG